MEDAIQRFFPILNPQSSIPPVALQGEAWNKASILHLFIENTGDETDAYSLFSG
jgi:hypothetical protein